MRADSTATAQLIAALDQQTTTDRSLTAQDKASLAAVSAALATLVRRLLRLIGIAAG
jgi:hypothetical protein